MFPNNKPPPNKQGGPLPPNNPLNQWRRFLWPAIWLVLFLWMFSRLPVLISGADPNSPITIPYSVFYDQVTAGNVDNVLIQDVTVTGAFKQPFTWPEVDTDEADAVPPQTSMRFTTTLLPVSDPELTEALRANNVTIVSQPFEVSPLLLFLLNFGPIILLLGFFIWQGRRAQRQNGNVFGFGRSQAREYDREKPKITFADVAGEEAAKSELVEIVDFLREPDKYISLGARIPRGVLLVGPPGTGKTLFARAVAGEANVAFFSISASEFVEMFVGVGASRVRDLFNKAKASAPAIIFIDEIDAVGRQRGAGMGGGNDEREQTLNQLLVEMDGFDRNETIIVMAATNRPDVLDPALLRPGRFDRQVTINLPDRAGRIGILKIHTRSIPLAPDVDLEQVARTTIGFSGADLANLANEAALTAARTNNSMVSMRHFSSAFDRILLGSERPPLVNVEERKVVAYHEAGHALVAALNPYADPVVKVTIVPRGRALGVTAQMPSDDRRNYSREYLTARMQVLMGGRSAEEIVIGQITTGAENDLREVTRLARHMVSQWGMSDTVGPLNFGDDDRQPFLGYSLSQGRNYSEKTASDIDDEVRRLVKEAHDAARHLLETNRDKLDMLANELLNSEIVEHEQVMRIAGQLPEVQHLPPVIETIPAQ